MRHKKSIFTTSAAAVVALHSVTASARTNCIDSYAYQEAEAYCEPINEMYGIGTCTSYVSYEPDIGMDGQYGGWYRLFITDRQRGHPYTFLNFLCYSPSFQ